MRTLLSNTRLSFLRLTLVFLLPANLVAAQGQETANPAVDGLGSSDVTDTTKSPSLDELFAQWKDYCATRGRIFSDTSILFSIEPFIQMRRRGVKGVAYFVDKLERDEDFGPIFTGNTGIDAVMGAVSQTSFYHIRVQTPENPDLIVYRIEEFPTMEVGRSIGQTRALWLKWWAEKDRKIPIWFRGRYQMWQAAKKTGDERKISQGLYKLKFLGIFALPQWIEKLNSDPTETKSIIGAISDLTAGEVAPAATKAQVLAWWKTNRAKWISPTAVAPIVKAAPTKAKVPTKKTPPPKKAK